jgi:multiple sugar transport system ATP-binding protein
LVGIGLENVGKRYGRRLKALVGIDMVIEPGERLAVLGPSGAGKSTLLRLIAGLEAPDEGTIRIDGQDVRGIPPHRRNLAMVFQQPVLYPHLNVYENLVFGLRAEGVPAAERRRRAAGVAERMGLSGLLNRRSWELSGGERQRVALGRVVVRRPSLLLLDEPFASLDSPLRVELRDQLIEIHRELGSTIVHVTHDQAEALSLGDRVAVLNRGRLAQVGTPRQVHDGPADRFVATFVGDPGMNMLPVTICKIGGSWRIQVGAGTTGSTVAVSVLPGLVLDGEGDQGSRVDLGLRASSIRVQRDSAVVDSQDWIHLPGILRRIEFQGDRQRLVFDLEGCEVVALAGPEMELREGEEVTVGLDLRRAAWFDVGSGCRLGGA